MTPLGLATLFVVGSLAGSLVAFSARAAQSPKPITESATIKATIEAIDQTAKTVTLKGPKGNFVEVDASGVPRFDQLKLGDNVDVTYTEALLLKVDPAVQSASE